MHKFNIDVICHRSTRMRQSPVVRQVNTPIMNSIALFIPLQKTVTDKATDEGIGTKDKREYHFNDP